MTTVIKRGIWLLVVVAAWADEPVQYRAEIRTTPRPLRIHVLTIDLLATNCEVAVAVGNDPDGDGPAEAQLVPPAKLATGFRAAVNANAWAMIPPPAQGERPKFVAGGACNVAGWVVTDGQQRSPPEKSNWSFWVDADRHGHIGSVAQPVSARQAVAGFGGLVSGGKILPKPSEVRHPRTALGLDATGQRVTLVVVDGRQPGFSEGLSEYELAELLCELGCRDALNFDGGGSSIMLTNNQIVNHPSESNGPRPVPVIVGVRNK